MKKLYNILCISIYIHNTVNNRDSRAKVRPVKGIFMNDNKSHQISRTEAREYLFALLFARTFAYDDDAGEFYAAEIENADKDFGLQSDYIHDSFFGIVDNMAEIDEKIENNSKGWNLSRLSRVTISLLRLCIYEMEKVDDVPKRAAMNEAIELAKKYDDDNAPAFINGVLDTVSKLLPDRECDK